MSQPPSFAPRAPKPRPSANGAITIRGRGQRMSRPQEWEARASRPVDPGPAAAPASHAAPASGAGAPPVYPPRRQRPARPARPEPLGLPLDEQPAPQPRRAAAPARQRPVPPAPPQPRRRRRRSGRRIFRLVALALIVFLIGWPIYLFNYGSSQLTHVTALSGAADTPGRTVLFAGTDKRSEEGVNDGVEGARSDSIMLVHVPASGTPSLISLPRDTYVQIPGHKAGKLNSSYSLGGPKLLVATVENLTGLTIDNYVEVGMDGISHLVDAVGGVELCLDYDVTKDLSGLEWEAGCHQADGPTALAFSRMRYSDPLGDIGRTARQRQVISQLVGAAKSPATLLNPLRQRALVGDGARQLTVDEDTSMVDLAKIGWSMRTILGPNGVVGTPPIAMLNYQPGGVGSTVLLDEAKAPEFFRKVADGSISQADVEVSLP